MKIIAILGYREEYLQFEILKGLFRMGVELIPSSPLNYIQNKMNQAQAVRDSIPLVGSIPINQPNYTDDEILEHSKDADYIFVFWNRFPHPDAGSPGGRMNLVDLINQPDKTVIIDGSESSFSGSMTPNQIWKDSRNYSKGEPWIWHYMRDRSKWYFKRETHPDDISDHNIIPCPYPCRIEDRREDFVTLDKDINLSCIFGQTYTGLREEARNASLKLSQDPSNSVFVNRSQVPREELLKILCRSKMHVDAWGSGCNCTVRRNETIMNSTAVIGQEWKIVVPNDYTDGENIINWDSVQEFEEKFHHYIKHPDKLIEIGKNAYNHALKYHTTEKRMEYIFDIITS